MSIRTGIKMNIHANTQCSVYHIVYHDWKKIPICATPPFGCQEPMTWVVICSHRPAQVTTHVCAENIPFPSSNRRAFVAHSLMCTGYFSIRLCTSAPLGSFPIVFLSCHVQSAREDAALNLAHKLVGLFS